MIFSYLRIILASFLGTLLFYLLLRFFYRLDLSFYPLLYEITLPLIAIIIIGKLGGGKK